MDNKNNLAECIEHECRACDSSYVTATEFWYMQALDRMQVVDSGAIIFPDTSCSKGD